MKRKRTSRLKDSTNDALRYALKLINLRDRTERELVQKLKAKGFSEGTAKETVDKLKELSLLDDRRAAQALVNYGSRIKGLGSKGLKRFCLERGVDESIIEELLVEEDDEKKAEMLIRKRLQSMEGLDREKKYRRLYGYLYRRGYPAEIITKLLRKYLEVEV
ncbi:MAG: regulatory protein RecX [Nitrospirae bacterium]|nr:MAG: regulatory protein RecX [Nitrospirota bacterium]